VVAFADLIQLPTLEEIKARVIALAVAAGLPVTSWIPGDPSERWTDIIPRAIDAFLSSYTTQAVRMFFLELATDPGDAGDLSPDQTARPGFLSALGAGWFGVVRGQATYAPGVVTITNAGTAPATFSAYDLTFQRSTAGDDGGYPTYRNQTDATVYTGPGETLTLAVGASASIPIIAEQIGSYANASPGEVSIVVTGSFGTFTVTNASPVRGTDREDRALYIDRCRLQSGAASPNGAADAYRYASTTGADGEPLQLWDGSGATSVNRVYVSPDSSTGEVLIYLANPSGPASSVEVQSANANINGITVADASGVVWNANPIGVVPDGIVLGPTVSDAKTGAPGPATAIATSVGFLAGTVRIKAIPGVASLTLIADIHRAIEAAQSAYFETVPIGGLDQVGGTGVVYRNDLEVVMKDSYPGLYAANLTKPASTTQVIALGHVPVYVGQPEVTAAAESPSSPGTVRLTVNKNLTGLSQVQIWEAVTSGGLSLVGTWNFTWINSTTIDLDGSVWTGSFTSCSLSAIIVTVV
jgi:hypothetical protein